MRTTSCAITPELFDRAPMDIPMVPCISLACNPHAPRICIFPSHLPHALSLRALDSPSVARPISASHENADEDLSIYPNIVRRDFSEQIFTHSPKFDGRPKAVAISVTQRVHERILVESTDSIVLGWPELHTMNIHGWKLHIDGSIFGPVAEDLGQDPDKWDAYRRAVIDKFPFVSRYEDAWPIARYAKGHLSYESRRRPKDIGAAAAERKQDQNIGPHRYHPYKESDNDEYIPTNISSVGKDVKPTTQDVQIPNMPMTRSRRAQGSLPFKHRSQHSNGDERELGKNAAGPKRQPRFNHAVSIEGTSTSSSSSKLTGDFDAVKAFLHDLSPPMVILAPKFWDAGIITLEHVRAVARMPKEQRDILLKDEMRLTRFESVSIYMGLDALQDSR
ncbi:hypothetical protein A0H81_13197 [Grifola frondosa]|uniref:Uncharacterized protein n=1 Tax=Grifola frondosa TaxID=5627 RepID=A0A1C7LQE1_GRIFR|nr:hypothetical protein A0H81_13197 [Grifola frondosa]